MAGSVAGGAVTALGVGVRSVFDRALWRQLFNSAWTSFLIKFGGVVVKSLLAFYIASHTHAGSTTLVECLVLFGLALLFWPRLMRSVTGVVTTNSLAGAAFMDSAGSAHAAPPTRQFRRWWMPSLVLGAASLFMVQIAGSAGLLDGWPYHALRAGLTLALVVASVPAVVRSVLATRFDAGRIERSLAIGHRAWLRRLVPLLSLQALLHPAAIALLTSDAMDRVPFLLKLPAAAALVGLWGATTVGLAAMTTWSAAAHLSRESGALEAAAPPTAPAAIAASADEPRPRWFESARKRRVVLASLMPLTLVLAWPWIGEDVVLLSLRVVPEFHDIGDYHGLDWDKPANRRYMHEQMACFGNVRTLRVMRWSGIDRRGRDAPDGALACAAANGELETARLLIELGDDVDRPVPNPQPGLGNGLLFSPLALASQSPRGLPGAELLLAHGARLTPAAPGHADAVQVAAAGHCLPCLEFLAQHGAAFDGRRPVTPLVAWFDDARDQAPTAVTTLEHLVALGMSPTAAGTDGRSALHAAAAAHDTQAVRWLLAHGGDPGRADSDGMTPLLYASIGYGTGGDDSAAPPSPQLALMLELLEITPSADGLARPDEGRVTIARRSPYIQAPFDIGAAAVRSTALRAAAARLAKPLRYGPGEVPFDMAGHEHDRVARDALARMSDDGFRAAMSFAGVDERIDSQGWVGRAFNAGWWPELVRAARAPAAFREAGSRLRCELMVFAMGGARDTSAERGDSWAVLQALLDAGARPSACDVWARGYFADYLAERTPAQREDWSRRTGG